MLKGVFAPIPTPFDDNGEIAFDRLQENLSRWADTRLTGLVVLGSNGEFVYLTDKEKVAVLEATRRHFPGDRPIIAGTGAESTRATIELTRRAADVGCDAALVLTPHYYGGGMTDAALTRFYHDVADASPIPIMLYNMPRNTGLNMSATLVSHLAQHQNIVGIKDSGGNIVQISQIIDGTPDDFSVFAGSGSFLLPSLVMGAVGATMAVANVLPDHCAEIVDQFYAGNLGKAVELQHGIIEANAAVTSRWGVPGLKAALDLIGYYGGLPRQPLLSVTDEDREELKRILTETGAFR